MLALQHPCVTPFSGGPCLDDSLGAGSGELIVVKGAPKESVIVKLDLYRVVVFEEYSGEKKEENN